MSTETETFVNSVFGYTETLEAEALPTVITELYPVNPLLIRWWHQETLLFFCQLKDEKEEEILLFHFCLCQCGEKTCST